MTPTTLTTARLRLEPLRVDDAAEMADVLADPALYRFTGGHPPGPDSLRRRYTAQVVGGSPDGRQQWLNWIVRDLTTGAAVGFVQATVERGTADVAWVIGSAHQGRGFATEAAAVVVDRLREQGVDVVRAYVHPGHLASAAVARAAGLVVTGRVVDGEVEWRSPATEPAVVVGRAGGIDPARLLAFWSLAAEDAHRPADSEDAVRRLLERDPAALLSATVGDVLVGTVVAGFDGWRCHLYRLAVHPVWRRRGIARQLVDAAERRFAGFGATRADAMVLDDNPRAHALWSGLGYARQADWARWVKRL
ncbi:GNAT family N-acetyltransferase [Jatrophihabitans sp. YIM 134969]